MQATPHIRAVYAADSLELLIIAKTTATLQRIARHMQERS